MPSYELLAADCPPGDECSKVVRRRPGVLTVVGASVTDPAEVSALGVGGGEGAVDITEELLRAAYGALVGEAS